MTALDFGQDSDGENLAKEKLLGISEPDFSIWYTRSHRTATHPSLEPPTSENSGF